jgi:phosphoribosylanthranilate isomerase
LQGRCFSGLIQVAGVHDAAEALLLAEEGVDAVGIPLRLPVHREDLSEAEAAAVFAALPASVAGVCITYLDDPDEIAALCRFLAVRAVQLHGPVPPSALARLRGLAPGLFVIKSLVVRGEGRAADAVEALAALRDAAAPFVDAFITDTHDPATGADGATGRTHDWAVSRVLAAGSPRPLILAGGLNPANVRRAIAAARPAGVDAHTGLEGPDGRKDAALVRRFVAEARAGFAALAATPSHPDVAP